MLHSHTVRFGFSTNDNCGYKRLRYNRFGPSGNTHASYSCDDILLLFSCPLCVTLPLFFAYGLDALGVATNGNGAIDM